MITRRETWKSHETKIFFRRYLGVLLPEENKIPNSCIQRRFRVVVRKMSSKVGESIEQSSSIFYVHRSLSAP